MAYPLKYQGTTVNLKYFDGSLKDVYIKDIKTFLRDSVIVIDKDNLYFVPNNIVTQSIRSGVEMAI